MTELLWQTVLLLAGAFFFGAVLACSLKRRFYYGPSVRAGAAAASGSLPAGAAPEPNADQPKIEVASQARPQGDRFERALSGTVSASAASPAAPAAPSQLVVPPTTVRVAPIKEAAPQPVAEKAAPAPASAPAPATAEPESTSMPFVSVSRGSGAPTSVEEGGAGPSDDLTRIDGVDSSMERRLREQGIRRLGDLADLTPTDVKGLSEALHVGGRIERENWAGQAQILAAGGETYYSRRVDHGVPVPEGVDPAAAVTAEPVSAPTSAPTAAPEPAATVPAAPEPLAPSPAPAPETVAKPAPAPEPAPVMPAPAPAPALASAPAPTVAAAAPATTKAADNGFAHLRSVRSEALRGEESAHALTGRPAGETDDLKRIRGIGVLIEKKLNSLGITHYEQIANWTGADVERISRLLDFKGRIEREAWIEQSRILATGGQTEFSRRGG